MSDDTTINIVSATSLQVAISAPPGRLARAKTVGILLERLDSLVHAISGDVGSGEALEWGVSDLSVADDGAVTVTLHAQRRAGR